MFFFFIIGAIVAMVVIGVHIREASIWSPYKDYGPQPDA
jgi:hypothetical protein